MRILPLVALLTAIAVLTGCETPPSGSPSSPIEPAPSPDPDAPEAPAPSPTRVPTQSVSNLNFTVYYTAVESFHSGATSSIRGCLDLECSRSGAIGVFPSSFAQAVKNEGTGRITSAPLAGRYLNWSYDVGYWLDVAPRDARGKPLIPWVSAAADSDVMDFGVEFIVTDCGRNGGGGGKVGAEMCGLLKAAQWRIVDRFTPGHGGARHFDLYIGEENIPNFEQRSPRYISTEASAIGVF